MYETIIAQLKAKITKVNSELTKRINELNNKQAQINIQITNNEADIKKNKDTDNKLTQQIVILTQNQVNINNTIQVLTARMNAFKSAESSLRVSLIAIESNKTQIKILKQQIQLLTEKLAKPQEIKDLGNLNFYDTKGCNENDGGSSLLINFVDPILATSFANPFVATMRITGTNKYDPVANSIQTTSVEQAFMYLTVDIVFDAKKIMANWKPLSTATLSLTLSLGADASSVYGWNFIHAKMPGTTNYGIPYINASASNSSPPASGYAAVLPRPSIQTDKTAAASKKDFMINFTIPGRD